MEIGVLEIIRYLLLIAAAGFSFLIWRWNHFESRREREELLRNRYVRNEVVFRVPTDSTPNDPHIELKIFKVRVFEEDGFWNTLRKVWDADFKGTTEFKLSSLYRIGRDNYRSQAKSPFSGPPRDKRPKLPENLEAIRDKEEFEELGLQKLEIDDAGNSFSIVFDSVDLVELEDRLNAAVNLIEDVSD